MLVRTVSEMFALANGKKCTGAYSCYYCSAPCDEEHSISVWVRESFNSHQYVKSPSSSYVCNGCVLTLNEDSTIELIDGTVREHQRIRLYSWFVTPAKAIAATKAHLHLLRKVIDNPPPPPFALVLAESGQKHLLYSGAVNHSHAT